MRVATDPRPIVVPRGKVRRARPGPRYGRRYLSLMGNLRASRLRYDTLVTLSSKSAVRRAEVANPARQTDALGLVLPGELEGAACLRPAIQPLNGIRRERRLTVLEFWDGDRPLLLIHSL